MTKLFNNLLINNYLINQCLILSQSFSILLSMKYIINNKFKYDCFIWKKITPTKIITVISNNPKTQKSKICLNWQRKMYHYACKSSESENHLPKKWSGLRLQTRHKIFGKVKTNRDFTNYRKIKSAP
jgi:hypothetical protein